MSRPIVRFVDCWADLARFSRLLFMGYARRAHYPVWLIGWGILRRPRRDRRFTLAGARLIAPAQGAQAVSFLRSRPGRSRARLLPPPPIWSRIGLFGGSLQSRPPISIIAVQSLERRCNRRPGIASRLNYGGLSLFHVDYGAGLKARRKRVNIPTHVNACWGPPGS